MPKKIISEIFLTSNEIGSESWLELFNNISNLNGKLRRWNFWIQIENNEIRYFTSTRKELPTVIGDLGDFLIKKIDEEEKNIDAKYSLPYIIKRKEKNILDVFDTQEIKRRKVLTLTKISVFTIKRDYFLFRTYLYLKQNEKLFKKRALFAIPQELCSVNFSEHSRFVYKKDACKYLNIEKSLHLFKTNKEDAILKVDTFPYLAGDYYLKLNEYDFDKHSIIVGASGTGKSKLICSIIASLAKKQEYRDKYKVVMIDPHASMAKDIEGIDKTKVINFESIKNSIDLFTNIGKDIAASIELILSLLKGLIQDQYNSKLERVLRQTICLLLTKNELTFQNLRKVILDMDYRNKLLKELENKLPESTIDFFASDFGELKNRSYQEAIAPIISFIDEMQLLPAFQNNQKQKGIKETINENFLTIFSLDQTILGEKVTKTISGLVMQQLLELVQAYSFDEHIIFVIDEVAVVENEILHRFLSEARKYNLSLILSQQYFSQISNGLQKAIFANVLNYYIFRVAKEDAGILESNILMEIAVKNSYHVKREILSKLSNRECIVRVSNNGVILSPFKARTMDFEPIHKQVVNQILDAEQILLNPQNTSILTKKSIENIKENISLDKEQEYNSNFSIDPNISLVDLMKSQSEGRKKVRNNG